MRDEEHPQDQARDMFVQAGELDLAEEWSAFFGTVIKAGHDRNEIIHNQLVTDIYESEGGIFGIRQGLDRLRRPGQPLIELGQVLSLIERIQEITSKAHVLRARTIKALM
jgi:hypothetical protein